MTPEQILAREIRTVLGKRESVEVKLFDESESWVALIDGVAYVCEIGSDDDGFLFTHEGDDEFYIPLPSDWPV